MMRFEDYQRAPIETRLQFWINMRRGSTLPHDWPANAGWDYYVRDICSSALEAINELKSNRGPQKEPWHRRVKVWIAQRLLTIIGEVR